MMQTDSHYWTPREREFIQGENKSEVNALLNSKADAENLSALAEVNSALSGKVDSLENYDDTQIKADIAETAEQSALNRGTLGYQRKNLLPNTAITKTANGVTFTINDENLGFPHE